MSLSTFRTGHLCDPLTEHLYRHFRVPESIPRPRTITGVWPFLGYEPRLGIHSRAKTLHQWKVILDSEPAFLHWLRSPGGLRAPRRWPQAIEEVMYDLDVFMDPTQFASGCFPGKLRISSLFTSWRGVPELCAAAHGLALDREEVVAAVDGVRQLAEYVPFVVYACRPNLWNVPTPKTGKDLMDRLQLRDDFVNDPLGTHPSQLKHVIDTRWTAGVIRGLPRLPWVRKSTMAPVERSLVEVGFAGWVPSHTRPQATTPPLATS